MKTSRNTAFSWRRLRVLCHKEALQIQRDPGNILIAFVIPIVLLVIFGYGINLDSDRLRIGIVVGQESPEVHTLVQAFAASPWIAASVSNDRQSMINRLQAGEISGMIVIPLNFAQRLSRPQDSAPIQVITDGTEPNTANFVQAYARGVWNMWRQQLAARGGGSPEPLIDVHPRYWFNAAAISQHFIIPGAIAIIMTVVGAILTSLVIAREWERGTMETLLTTQVTRTELLLSKIIPYYFLGMIGMLLCLVVAVLVMGVPFRGSLAVLLAIGSLFLISTLGMGLFISSVTRNQFNAALITVNTAFLPAVMLSGFIFEIASMPALIRAVTWVIPARYFVSTLQTLFLAGNIEILFFWNAFYLLVSALFFIGLTAWKLKRRLD